MKPFNKKEYLDIIQKLVQDQYGDLIDNYGNIEWIPAEPEIKQKLIKINNTIINLTDLKNDDIRKNIILHNNFKIYSYKLKINNCNFVPNFNGKQTCFNITIWEEKNKTPNGHPCKIEFPVNLEKDSRFNNRPWLKYFSMNDGTNIPLDTILDIIKWLKTTVKLKAFI